MPITMREPVLTVDESRIGTFDPQDPVALSVLWSAFSRTSHVIQEGERLKNLSWRLWNRETLCGARQVRKRPQVARSSHNSPGLSIPATVPELSSSVESSSSTETQDETPDSSELTLGQPIPMSNASKERHITPNDLRNLVHSIKQSWNFRPRVSAPRNAQKDDPIAHQAAPPPEIPASSEPCRPTTESSTSTVATATDSFASTSKKSDTSVSSTGSTHSIVRGFTPGANGITSYRSNYQLEPQPQPILKKGLPSHPAISKKKGNGMFMLGCSSGSGASAEDEDLLKDRVTSHPPSSISTDSRQPSNSSKKQTSFKEEVSVMKAANPGHQDEAVFESDEEDSEEEEDDDEDEDEEDDDEDEEDDDDEDEDEEVSESAIEDDDEWEDEGSEAHEPEHEKEMKFYRVESKANLPSHRSLLTLNLEDQRNASRKGVISTPAFRRSRTSTPNGPSMPGSPEEDIQLEQRIQRMQSSKPIVVNAGNIQPPAPLTSPRTTRRNMMAGELSESLRKNMLSERQQKNPLRIDSNQMRRAHTAQDVSKLSKLPEHAEPHNSYDQPPCPYRDTNKVSWNHFFDNSIGEFNQAGW